MLPQAGGVRSRRTRARRGLVALALAALTMSSVPHALMPHGASAQGGVGDATGLAFDRSPPDYMEGERVRITVSSQGVDLQNLEVRVRCLACPEENVTFRAPARSQVTFPDDFGVDAVLDGQPRWNDTWLVELVGGDRILQAKEFRTWLLDAHRFPGGHVPAGSRVRVTSSGLAAVDEVTVTLRQQRGNGSFETVLDAITFSGNDGRAHYAWSFDKSVAQRLDCPGRPPDYCRLHELVVNSTGKTETVRFLVVPASLTASVVRGPATGETATPLPRTTNVSLGVLVAYPDHKPVTPQDLQSVGNPNGVLRFRLERHDTSPTGSAMRVLANFTGEYVARESQWRVNWTIPRDEEVRSDRYYRMVVLDQRDRFGNTLHARALNNFTVEVASLEPLIQEIPREVERLEEAKTVVAFRYLDGSPIRPADLDEAPRACLVRADASPQSCDGGIRVDGAYWEDGLWNFTHRFPVGYPHLVDHRFLYEGGSLRAKDRYGNVIESLSSGERTFRVGPAKIRVDLQTLVAGEARDAAVGWTRGEVVAFNAVLTYPDGRPFNVTTNRDREDVIPVTLAKVGRDGGLMGTEVVNLTNRDARTGSWVGSYRVPRDANLAPPGEWELRIAVRDNETVPNANDTTFFRNVSVSRISVVTTKEPPLRAPIGALVDHRFRLVYSDGLAVRPADVGSNLRVEVVRASGSLEGAVVSGALLPSYDPGRDEWSVEWEVPRELFQGSFAFKPNGLDRHGNLVDPNARSRAFSTFTDSRTRAVLTEPPTRIERGESAVVVFDGRDGDQGLAGIEGSAPAIEAARWDASRGEWVVELRNVRVNESSGGDHVGRADTSHATTLGLYRFQLRGRDVTYNLIEAVSDPFTVVPSNVTRAILVPPPERIGKGEPVEWSIERELGDRITSTHVLFDGRLVGRDLLARIGAHSTPISQSGPDRYNFTWRVPYTADNGLYSFRVNGRDAYGNAIVVDVPPVAAEPSVLSGQVLGNPDRIVPRGRPVTVLLAVTAPTGDPFASRGTPEVLVVNATGVVDRADVAHSAGVHEATWTPPVSAGLGNYWFEVSGQDESGNVFPSLRSSSFEIVPGSFERKFVQQPKSTHARLQEIRLELAARPDDLAVAFTLVRVSEGPASLTREPVTVATLDHVVDSTGRYVVTWTPKRDERLGSYAVRFTGVDRSGNEFRGSSAVFALRTVGLTASIDTVDRESFGPGKTVVLPFAIRFAFNGAPPVDPAVVFPEVFMLYEGTPIADPVPEVRYDDATRRFVAEWTAPEVLPNGRYVLLVQGQDDAGNPLSVRRSQEFLVETTVVNSLLNVVPGADAALVAVAFAVALALAGRLRPERRR